MVCEGQVHRLCVIAQRFLCSGSLFGGTQLELQLLLYHSNCFLFDWTLPPETLLWESKDLYCEDNTMQMSIWVCVSESVGVSLSSLEPASAEDLGPSSGAVWKSTLDTWTLWITLAVQRRTEAMQARMKQSKFGFSFSKSKQNCISLSFFFP